MAPRLSIIPAGAVTDRSLEPRDLQVLCLLGRHTEKSGWCRRSQVKMASELNCGRASVQRSLERLVEAEWVQKKRPAWSNEVGQPSHSYMYRVVLDRDDLTESAPDDADGDTDASHAEDANQEGECPPVGTPLQGSDEVALAPSEVPARGHPGAQPYVGTGAQPYVGTKNDPLERSPLERERDARARRDRKAKFIVAFEMRWPTSAADDRQRTAYAAEELTEAEEEACLAAIGPFLERLKKLGRRGIPAGSKFIEERRWTLLEKPADAPPPMRGTLAPDSVEGRAVFTLYAVARTRPFVLASGQVSYAADVTPQLLAFATAPPRSEWVWIEASNQMRAWGDFVAAHVKSARPAFTEIRNGQSGIYAPWPWPPNKDGTVHHAAPSMTNDDVNTLANEG